MSQGERNGMTRMAFLAAYAECGILAQASKATKCSRHSHYRWLKSAKYRELFAAAHEVACEALEAEARRRAIEGWEEPVFYEGKVCKVKKRKYSDTLLIFIMKGAMPDKYKDRVAQEVSMDVNSPAQIAETEDFYGNADRLREIAAADDASATGTDRSGEV